jgi:hypothetical protein
MMTFIEKSLLPSLFQREVVFPLFSKEGRAGLRLLMMPSRVGGSISPLWKRGARGDFINIVAPFELIKLHIRR